MPPEAALADAHDDLIDAAELDGEGGDTPPEDPPEVLTLAASLGWKNPKDWKGEPPSGGLKTAKDFLAELPEVMRNTRKKADRLEGTLSRVVAQVAKLDRHTSAKDDMDARAAARAEMEAGNFDEAEKILTAARTATAAEPGEAPALTAFKERNEWYGVDDEATAYVASLDQQFAKASGGVPDPDAHMRKIEVAVKKRFPELFETPDDKKDETERRRAPLVQRGGRAERARTSNEKTVADLTPAERRAAETMGVSAADYVKSYNKLNRAS